jgi:glycosyltransferase involved in cell wall biosynthesis
MEESPVISIIIPAYNEAVRIGATLESVAAYLSRCPWPSEIIVVDDGSTDETVALAEKAGGHHQGQGMSIQVIRNPGNKGKGYSVRNGVLHARAEIVMFTDADLSAPITELPKLVEPIQTGQCDIVIGSRAVDRSLIGIRQSPFREFAGRIYNLLMRVITGLNLKDTQCGFKAYRRQAVLPVFEVQRIAGFSFDVEILYLAKKRRLSIMEVPVVWNHAEGSRVRMMTDSMKMFLDLLRIRWNGLLGRYH